MAEIDPDYTATMASEINTLYKQVDDMCVSLDNYTDHGQTADWNGRMTDIKTHLDSMKDTISKLQDTSMYIPLMDNLKSPEDISFRRENPGRRKQPSVAGDSGLGSSSFGSVVSSRCLTCYRHSVFTLPSNIISNIPESCDDKVERFIQTNDFKLTTADHREEYEPGDKQLKSENDLSKPTATEHTESSESDNEKQPVYSSDESRLTSLNSVSFANKETQTILCASYPRMSNFSHVTETFYELEEREGDTYEARAIFTEHENPALLVNGPSIVELAMTDGISET